MSLPTYPECKDSGIEWVGDMPARWQAVRVGALFREVVEDGENGLPILSVSIHDGVSDKELNDQELDRKVTRSDDLSKYKKVLPGDLVYNMMRAWQGGFGSVTVEGMVSPAYMVARPVQTLSTKFVELLLRTPQATEELRRYSKGITDFRLRLYWEEFKSIRLPVAPLSEQLAIVAFLDHETGKIDALVAEQERLIALLKEKRRAVISHAVTKGLNPTAPMKDSGIEWLGQVPAHWAIGSLKRFWSVTDCKHVTAQFVEEGVPLASIREVQSRYVDLDAAKQTTDEFYDILIEEGRKPEVGDLIFSRNATVGEVAQVADWHAPFAMGQDVCLLRKRSREASSDFMQSVLRSKVTADQLEGLMIGSTFKRVNVEEIRNLIVPMPPEQEQAAIAASLGCETTGFDTLISEAQRAIDLLKERRSALISAAVTGKIDVRGLARKVIEEVAA